MPNGFFDTLVESRGRRRAKRKLTLPVSIGIHVAVLAAVVVGPLLSYNQLPEVTKAGAIHAFVAEAAPAPPPPPPPPPPPAAAAPRPVTAPKIEQPKPVVQQTPKFTAPVETPVEAPQEAVAIPAAAADPGPAGEPGGVEGGVKGGEVGGVVGGVEGGVKGGEVGGVVGGVIGGIPKEEPAAPSGPVRVGGQIKAPKKIRNVDPQYPDVARSAHVTGVVIIEATIGPDGSVTNAKVLRGVPLLDRAALDAVRQWSYSPTLLNGVPVPVIMTVTVNFRM